MDNFQSTAIVNLQNFLHTTNIERLIKRFIKKHVNEEEQPFNIDSSKGIISYYSAISDEVLETKFETELKDLLWKFTNDIKSEIDLSNVKLTNKERVKFWNNILKSFDYIEKTHYDVISTFPICLKPSEEINNYLKNKYQFPLEINNDSPSYFNLKRNYSRKDLKSIYDFMDEFSFIDADYFTFDEFYSLLSYRESSEQLKLKTSTEVLVCILEELSFLYTDMTRRKIEESGRFLTKSGKVLSVSNYENTIKRIKSKNNQNLNDIRNFFSKTFPR